MVLREGPLELYPQVFTLAQEASYIGQIVPGGWWIDYEPLTTIVVPGCKYYPQIFNRSYFTNGNLTAAAAYGRIIGYNEPDLASGANVTVAQALLDWPSFEATGALLGSPPVAGDAVNGSWLPNFMNGNGGGYIPHVDFIVAHLYQDPTSGTPLSQATATATTLQNIFNKYGKPVLLTETGLIKFVGSDSANWVFGSQSNSEQYNRELARIMHNSWWFMGFAPYPMAYDSTITTHAPGSTGIVLVDNSTGLLTQSGVSFAGSWL